jgi:hypothetical protein
MLRNFENRAHRASVTSWRSSARADLVAPRRGPQARIAAKRLDADDIHHAREVVSGLIPTGHRHAPAAKWTDGAFPVLDPRGFYSTSVGAYSVSPFTTHLVASVSHPWMRTAHTAHCDHRANSRRQAFRTTRPANDRRQPGAAPVLPPGGKVSTIVIGRTGRIAPVRSATRPGADNSAGRGTQCQPLFAWTRPPRVMEALR